MTTPDQIQVRLNGEDREFPRDTTVLGMVQELGLDRGGVAVEINRTIVPRSTFEERALAPSDEIEIVTVLGGG